MACLNAFNEDCGGRADRYRDLYQQLDEQIMLLARCWPTIDRIDFDWMRSLCFFPSNHGPADASPITENAG